MRCWGFHRQATCTRKQRCKTCSSKEHDESTHLIGCSCPDRCTNCRGPHTADDNTCLARPYFDAGGVLQRKTRAQIGGIQRAQSSAYEAKCKAANCSIHKETRPGPSGSPEAEAR